MMKSNLPDESPSNKPLPSEATAVLQHAKPGARFSWTWLFPLLALVATGWLFFDRWQQEGPMIEVIFEEAPGIEAGKTKLIFRGTPVGEVHSIRLDENLQQVVVGIRLKAFAREIAREGTQFWIEQPEVSLRGFAGLEALIQGNSIQARVEDQATKAASSFHGLAEAPLSPLQADMLRVELTARTVPFLSRGTPIFHRGTQVGWVSEKGLDEEGKPRVYLEIKETYAHTVHRNSRFWILPAAALSVTPGEVQLSLPSLMGLLEGGITYDTFEPGTEAAQAGDIFELSPNEIAARADGPRVTIDFADVTMVREGETRVYYLGQPVGVVESMEARPQENRVRVTARLKNGMASHLTSTGVFHLVRPGVTWSNSNGLEVLLTGPYIAFEPGEGGEAASHFDALDGTAQVALDLAQQNSALRVVLLGEGRINLAPGTPLYHRGLQAGAVLKVGGTADGDTEITVGLREGFAQLIEGSTRFWSVPALEVAAGPGVLDVSVPGLLGLLRGGILFDNFGEGESTEPPAEAYRLYANEAMARAVSPPARITFAQAQGVQPGRTQLRFRGIPVGMVEKVKVEADGVEVTARFFPGYDFLRRTGSTFAIVQPEVSLQGVEGLETLLSGVYISCLPGNGRGFAANFSEWVGGSPVVATETGFLVRLTTANTLVSPGAPVIYNTLTVGEVTKKELVEEGRQILLEVRIQEEYGDLVKSNSIFWDASALDAQVGIFKVQVKAPTLAAPDGKVAFFTPPGGNPVRSGTSFVLNEKRPKEAR